MNHFGTMMLAILSCFLMLPLCSESSNAGFGFGITKAGLNYASATAVELLEKKLLDHAIENARGEHGDFKYEISNIKAQPISGASSSVELKPPVMSVTLQEVDLTMTADWRYSYEKNRFIKIRDSGSLTISAKGLSVEVEVSFGFDSSTKVPSIKSESCRAGLNDIHFETHGKASILYNTLFSLARGVLEDILKRELCRAAERGINENLNGDLSGLSMEVKVGQDLLLDYRLTAAPEVKGDRIEFSHAGVVFGDAVPKISLPENQPTLCELETPATMIQGVVTEDFLNSYIKALYLTGKMKIMMTRNDLPDSEKTILDTNCKGMMCVPKWITNTIKDVPNASLEISFEVTDVPTLTISEERNISVGARSKAAIFVRYQNDTVLKLFTVRIKTFASAAMAVHKGLLRFSLGNLEQKITLEDDDVMMEAKLKGIEIAERMLRKNFLRQLNDKGEQGIPIPDAGDFSWADTSVKLKDRALCFSTNLKYKISY